MIKIHHVVDVHFHSTSETEVLKLLNIIFKQNTKIMGAFEDLQAQFDRQETAISGIKKDITFIKKQLENNPGGLTAEQVATLLTRATTVADTLEGVDAETDSDETPTEPTV